MLEDSKKAMSLSRDYFKAYLRHGEALVEIGKSSSYNDTKLIDQGIESINKALRLCWRLDPRDKNYDQKQLFETQMSK